MQTHDTTTPVPDSKKAEYWVWVRMRRRCYNPKHQAYPRYGGRGITVCDRWRESFAAFYEDVGPRPSPAHSIDRIDVNRGYEPDNVRWATAEVQYANKRNSILITYKGRTQPLHQWARELGIHRNTASYRYHQGMSPDQIFSAEPLPNSGQFKRHKR